MLQFEDLRASILAPLHHFTVESVRVHTSLELLLESYPTRERGAAAAETGTEKRQRGERNAGRAGTGRRQRGGQMQKQKQTQATAEAGSRVYKAKAEKGAAENRQS